MIFKLKNNFMPTIEKCHVSSNWYNISNVILYLEYIWVYTLIIIKKNKFNIFFNMKVFVSILEYYLINNFDILQPELTLPCHKIVKLSHILKDIVTLTYMLWGFLHLC